MRIFVYALIATLALAGCEEKGPTIAEIQLTGTYTLRTVNGNNLPYVLSASNPMIELMASTLTLHSNGSYTDVGSLRVTNAGVVSTGPSNDAGTYRLTNGTVTFASTVFAGLTLSGTPGENSLTIVSQGTTSVYRRQ